MKRSLSFYGTDGKDRGWIGIDGDIVPYLTNGVIDGHLAQAMLVRGGMNVIRMFGREFSVQIIKDEDFNEILEVYESGNKTYNLKWQKTIKSRWKESEVLSLVHSSKEFTKQNILRTIIRKILEPEKESGEWAGGGD